MVAYQQCLLWDLEKTVSCAVASKCFVEGTAFGVGLEGCLELSRQRDVARAVMRMRN